MMGMDSAPFNPKKKLPIGMSNFYHTVPRGLAKALRADPAETYSTYPGKNFNGCVHAVKGGFACEVMQRRGHVATVTAPTLKQLMVDVCNRFGWE